MHSAPHSPKNNNNINNNNNSTPNSVNNKTPISFVNSNKNPSRSNSKLGFLVSSL